MRSLCLFAGIAVVAGATGAQGFDAGGFAMQQHYHSLMEQQSGVDAAPDAALAPDIAQAMRADIQRIQQEHRLRLESEYDLRVQRDGRLAADQWLAQEADRLGREAALYIRETYGLN